jgi:tetratricopeptide (TPR) repeat protein
MKLFKKKEVFKVKSVPLDPTTISNPTTAADYHSRGTAYYARKQFEFAAEDFKKAIDLDGKMVDAYYSLGMVLKAIGRKEEAATAFGKVVDLVTPDTGAGNVSADMLRRLALGHMNELTQGDWNLEKEIWKHID